MIKLSRAEAFERACKVFGPWGTWSRSQNQAYGLIRGRAYEDMEHCSNDNPLAGDGFLLAKMLHQLGAWWDRAGTPWTLLGMDTVREMVREVCGKVNWVKKPVRVRHVKEPKAAE